MKSALLALVGLVGATASASAEVLVEFNKDLLASIYDNKTFAAGSHIKFLEAETEPMPLHLLSSFHDQQLPSLECAVTTVTQKSNKVKVMLAVSTCLTPKFKESIVTWVQQMKDNAKFYFKDGEAYEIEYQTTVVHGECQAAEEDDLRIFPDAVVPDTLMAQQRKLMAGRVSKADLASFSMFEAIGPVTDISDTVVARSGPVAVLSFITDAASFEVVTQYERTLDIDSIFNFHVCESGVNACGSFTNCIDLQDNLDLFMYSPFSVVRKLQCTNVLKDGLPVSYVETGTGLRKCFCACPAGTKLDQKIPNAPACVPNTKKPCTCAWSASGYKHEITTAVDTCSFKELTTWSIPAPFPSDNYVGDKRQNIADPPNDLSNGPRVEVTMNEVSPLTAPLGQNYNNKLTWAAYQTSAKAALDKITFTSYGTYDLQVTANDYKGDASCKGCVSIVDKFRPHARNTCPTAYCDKRVSGCGADERYISLMTDENLARSNALVQQFYQFQQNVQNDACSTNARCDLESFKKRDFFVGKYSDDLTYTSGQYCFNPTSVQTDFLESAIAKTNPLVYLGPGGAAAVLQNDPSITSDQCTRCCKYRTELKEKVTDFTCGSSPPENCVGDPTEFCAFDQCLQMYGDTLATAVARIKPDVAKASQDVLDKMLPQGYQTTTQIHRGLTCTKFGGAECSFSAKVYDLLDIESRLNLAAMVSADSTKYVFWRYRLDNGVWKLFDNTQAAETFTTATTKITLEAWSQCGRVRKFYFYVLLHLNTEIKVCDKFAEMWYQSSVARVQTSTNFCAYPGADFAEITFDYHPNIGLLYSRNKLKLDIAKVSCSMSVNGRKPTTILTRTAAHPEIVQHYGIELAHTPTTKRLTTVNIACQFDYTQFDGSTASQTCYNAFTLADCGLPGIDCPDGECDFSQCSESDKPGMFQACGGAIVKSNARETYLDIQTHECCQACTNSHVSCDGIFKLGLRDEVKMCTPHFHKLKATGEGEEEESEDVVVREGNDSPLQEPLEDEGPVVKPLEELEITGNDNGEVVANIESISTSDEETEDAEKAAAEEAENERKRAEAAAIAAKEAQEAENARIEKERADEAARNAQREADEEAARRAAEAMNSPSLLALAKASQLGKQSHLALLGAAGALVAVVALVVVRRRGASRTTQMEDDAYFALLQ